MRQLRTCALALLAVFALGSLAAATASATEGNPGWLPLEALKETTKVTTTSAITVFKSAAGEISCPAVSTLNFNLGKAGDTHFTLSTDTDVHVTGCTTEKGKIKCRSEGLKGEKDEPGVILFLVDFHLVDLLNGAKLEPGVAWIILDMPNAVPGAAKIICGVLVIEVKGAAKGLVLVSSLSMDITSGTFHWSSVFDKCDANDKLCLELEEKEPFLCKFGAVYEPCTLEALIPFTLNQMTLVDD